MNRLDDRVACAVAVVGGLALGDPTGAHVLLTPEAVEYRRAPQPDPLERYPWPTVHGMGIDARATRSRRPASVAVLVAAAAESLGLDWTPGIAPVIVEVRSDGGSADLVCDGYIGRGYWQPHLDALQAGTHVLAAHASSQGTLARPSQVLADLQAVVGSDPYEARRRLADTWGAECRCV